MGLTDLLFPKRCVGCKTLGSYLCSACFSQLSFSTSYLCFVCNRPSLDGLTHPVCKKAWTIDGIYSSLVYSGVVKRLVYQFKYQPYVTDLQHLLSDLFYEGIIQHEGLTPHLKESFLVPIPLTSVKKRTRGYNQAEMLAKGVGERAGLLIKNLLIRQKKTESQFSLNRDQRRINLKDAFKLDTHMVVPKEKTMLLVDDVVTSGATLLEAAKVLKRAGAGKVFGITLAHGQ